MSGKKKPLKGIIVECKKYQATKPTEEHLGYLYTCVFIDHPKFGGRQGHTSLVVKEYRNKGKDYVETLNSRYIKKDLKDIVSITR